MDTKLASLKQKAAPALIFVLLACFLFQGLGSMVLMNASSDEVTHLPSGYTYLKTGKFVLNPQHPPLIKELSALPLLLIDPPLPLRDGWEKFPPNEWQFGKYFLYTADADRLLFWGRVPVLLLALLLGLYVYRWSNLLFGPPAGLMALTLYSFSPNVIAHSRFVTTDLGVSCFFVVALYHLWRFQRGAGRRHFVFAALGLGLAMGSKFSGVILLPLFALLMGLHALRQKEWKKALFRSVGGFVLVLAVSFFVLDALYFFPDEPGTYWRHIASVNSDRVSGYPYYLMGEFDVRGWWHYFAVAAFFKTTLPVIALSLGALCLSVVRPDSEWMDDVFILLPMGVYFVFVSLMADNIGVRYVLPLYPLAFIIAGRMAIWGRGASWRWVCVITLLLAHVVSAVRIYPDYLAYFNELAGGPEKGHLILDDSNIDWGQDLKRLKTYMEEHDVEHVKLHYPWNGDPAYYGISSEPATDHDIKVEPSPGVYAVSTHMLVRGEYDAMMEGANSDWMTRYEPIARIGYSIYLFEFPKKKE